MVGELWSALFHSCFPGIHVPSCWVGLSRAEGWCPRGIGQRSPAHSLLFPCRWGWDLTQGCEGLYVTSHPNGSPSCGPP